MTIQEQACAGSGDGLTDDEAVAAGRRARLIRHHAIQFSIIAAAAGAVILFCVAVADALAAKGIRFSFSFLNDAAGFDLSEGITLAFGSGAWPWLEAFNAEHTIAQAFITGLFNTIKISVLGIILSTLLGTMLGVGRLSTNWVVRNLSFWIVEFIRNTPLLIQVVFWYFAVVLQFPPMASAAKLYGGIILSQQGIYFPWPATAGSSVASLVLFAASVVLLLGALGWKARPRWILAATGAILLSLAFVMGLQLTIDYPLATRFQASGGIGVSPEMAAILLAIVFNTAAYIAEIVRGAIDALPKGQWEAAASIGLSRRHTLNDIILPQVFRVVLPSFGNQYISLAKNTALGIAIGFPELFNVYGTIANQTGHSLEGVVIVMLAYLVLSWIISAVVSFLDGRLAKRGATR